MSAEYPKVIELGDEGNQWLVTGTTDAHSADEAVRQFVEARTGNTMEAYFDAEDLVDLAIIRCDDFRWWPADPMGNRIRGSQLQRESPRSARCFSGFLVEA